MSKGKQAGGKDSKLGKVPAKGRGSSVITKNFLSKTKEEALKAASTIPTDIEGIFTIEFGIEFE